MPGDGGGVQGLVDVIGGLFTAPLVGQERAAKAAAKSSADAADAIRKGVQAEADRFEGEQKKQRSAQAALASRIGEKNKPNRTTILTSPLGVSDKGRTILGG